MRLEAFGWDESWSQQFQQINTDNAALLLPGRVSTYTRSTYAILTAAGDSPAEVSGRFAHEAQRGDFPAVGDWVAFTPGVDGGPAIIHHLLPRRTKLSRKVAGSATQEQVIAANVDVLFIVCGLDGDYNLRRLERYLVAASDSGAERVIVLNKSDLCTSEEVNARQAAVRDIAPGISVIALSALAPEPPQLLQPFLAPHKTGALLGTSGAGKSTIVNALLGDARQTTQTVRESDDRGRHTTTQRELFVLPGGGLILDNPGIRELQLWPEKASFESTFPDIEALATQCAFRDCRHKGDRGCAVAAAIASGGLDAARWESYLKLQNEMRHVAVQVDDNVRREEKRRIKKLHSDQKRNYKLREKDTE
ncbi:MAG: ribosome small subunit-dependent GTPase A [Terriglobales bacterium]